MARILKFEEYRDWEVIGQEFLYIIQNPNISESEDMEDTYQKVCKDILEKFGFNIELALTFGTGVKLMFPIVQNLISNLELEIKPSFEDIVLLCITTLSIMFLRYKREPVISANDIKNKLNPELQLKFGNPRNLVTNLVACFNHIYDFISKFPKLFGVALSNIFDMFSYTSILLPVMNAIGSFCDKYDFTPENLAGNLASLGVGISSIVGKRLYDYVKNKIKGNGGEPIEEPSVLSDVGNLDEIDLGGTKLINEQ
jgi:hypothetical protein